MITSEQINDILITAWPDLKNIWDTDPCYAVMSSIQLTEVLKNCSVQHLDYTDAVWDCDDFSLQLQAKVQKYQYNLIKSGKLDTRYSFAY